MVREDGVQVKFVVSHRVYEAFKAEISVNEPYLHKGFIGSQVERAMELLIVHLRKTRSSTQHAAREQHNAKEQEELIELRDSIIEYMLQSPYWKGLDAPKATITQKHLFEAIYSIRAATDIRVPKKWTKKLIDADLINRTGAKQFVFTNLFKDKPENAYKLLSDIQEEQQVQQKPEPEPMSAEHKKKLEELRKMYGYPQEPEQQATIHINKE